MKYRISIRTEYEAETHQEAIKKAEAILNLTTDSEFEHKLEAFDEEGGTWKVIEE